MLSLLLHSPLLGLFLGPVVTYAGDGLHRGWTWLDNQSAMIKQAFAVVLALVLVGLTHFVSGFVTPAECGNIVANGVGSACMNALSDPAFLKEVITQVITGALTAVAVKHGQQNAKA